MKENDTNIKVPFISKLAYGMGDVGCNFSWMFVGNFLMIFYTDVFGISMSVVLIASFWAHPDWNDTVKIVYMIIT